MSDAHSDDGLGNWAMEVGRTEQVAWRPDELLGIEFKAQAGAAGLDSGRCTVRVAPGRIAIVLRGSTVLESEWDETDAGAHLLFSQFLRDFTGEPS